MDHPVNGAPKSGGSRVEHHATMAIAGALGLALTSLAIVVTAESSGSAHPELAAAARGAIVALPIGVGLYASAWRPYRRFGLMLVLIGAGWSLAALAESNDAVLYSTGRVAAWMVEVGFVWAILAFPSGSLTGRWSRGLGGAF